MEDDRRVDLLARGLPLFSGIPICGDASLVSPVHADGTAWSGADAIDGVALERTIRRHEDRYPELLDGHRARLVVLACEVGGRWSQTALDTLRQLSWCKSREASRLLQRSVALAWHQRWLSFLSVATQTALAETLIAP